MTGQGLALVQELCQLEGGGILGSGKRSFLGSLAGFLGGLALGLCLFGSSLGLGQIIDELSLDLNDLLIGLGHLAGILGSLGGRGSSLDLGLLRSLERQLGSGLCFLCGFWASSAAFFAASASTLARSAASLSSALEAAASSAFF